MYNEKQKRAFIESYTDNLSTSGHALALFRAFEKFEIQWKADLCTRSIEEIKTALDNISLLRSKSNRMMLSILKEYIRWCVRTNIQGVRDEIFKIKSYEIVGIDTMQKQTVANPLQLQAYLDSMFDEENLCTLDNIYRCCCWLAYGGLEEEEIAQIRCRDVDLSKMVVAYGDKEIPIYREALSAFRNSVELDEFLYIHPRYRCMRSRVQGDKLIRGIKANMNIDTIRPVLSTKNRVAVENEKTDKKLSFYRMRMSGLYYRIYERERAGVPVSFRDEAIKYVEIRQFSGGISFERRVDITEKEYFDDYQRWKLAFAV